MVKSTMTETVLSVITRYRPGTARRYAPPPRRWQFDGGKNCSGSVPVHRQVRTSVVATGSQHACSLGSCATGQTDGRITLFQNAPLGEGIIISLCSATYVPWQHGTAYIRLPHAIAAAVNRYLLPTMPTAANLQQWDIHYVTKPIRSTQPCIPPGSLNWVPASARAGISPLLGGR